MISYTLKPHRRDAEQGRSGRSPRAGDQGQRGPVGAQGRRRAANRSDLHDRSEALGTFVPGFVEKALAETSLPALLDNFKKRAEKLHPATRLERRGGARALQEPEPRAIGAAPELPRLSVSELRERFEERARSFRAAAHGAAARNPRAACARWPARIDKRQEADKRAEERRLDSLRSSSRALGPGVELVGGVDEVGMAPLAGPVDHPRR